MAGNVFGLFVRLRRAGVVVLVMLLAASFMVPQALGAQFEPKTPLEPTAEPADPEDLGLVGRRAYESPQFGYTINWSREWDLDEFYDEPLISDLDLEQDRIYLAWTGSGRNQYAYLIVTGQTASRGGVKEDVAEWTDPDFIDDVWGDTDLEAEVILDDSTRRTGAVLFSLIDTGNKDTRYLLLYQAIELRDGTMIYLSFMAAERVFEAAWEATADLEVNGEPVLQFLDWDDIEDALDS